MPVQRTLAIIKPDGVMMGKVDDIIGSYRGSGLKVIRQKKFKLSQRQAAKFYAAHEGKFFFAGLILFMSSGPSVFLELEGENAIGVVRALNGHTNPAEAGPGTIRHDYRSAGGPCNTVHGSENAEDYDREWVTIFDR